MANAVHVRRTKLGKYELPTKAVRGLAEEGIDETNINLYKVKELLLLEGFGDIAAKMLTQQRAKFKANNKRRHQRSKGVQAAKFQRLHDESTGVGIGEQRDPNAKTPDWLKMSTGNEDVEVSKTLRLPDNRLRIDIGKEHGFDKRHALWVQNMVRNAPKEMLVTSVERLMVKIIRQAYANDATKGGTIGLATVESLGEETDSTPRL